jgi:hypothetical protein
LSEEDMTELEELAEFLRKWQIIKKIIILKK